MLCGMPTTSGGRARRGGRGGSKNNRNTNKAGGGIPTQTDSYNCCEHRYWGHERCTVVRGKTTTHDPRRLQKHRITTQKGSHDRMSQDFQPSSLGRCGKHAHEDGPKSTHTSEAITPRIKRPTVCLGGPATNKARLGLNVRFAMCPRFVFRSKSPDLVDQIFSEQISPLRSSLSGFSITSFSSTVPL